MKTWRCGLGMVCLGFLVSTGRSRDEDAIKPREWYSSGDSNPRVLVRARDPGTVQTLSVWSRRGVDALERAWARAVPFRRGAPLIMVVTPEAERVDLRARRTEKGFSQTLWIPEAPGKQDPRELANQLTRALVQRMVLAEDPGDAETWRAIPDWMVLGNRHHLLPGEGAALFGALMERGRLVDVPSPEVVAAGSREGGDPLFTMRAALLCRWIVDQTSPSAGGESVSWAALAETRRDPAAFWAGLAGVADLRDLHLRWDLWLANQSRDLITAYALESAAMERLEDLLEFYPASLGYRGEDLRYRRASLPDLAREPDAPNLVPMLTAWTLRLEMLRFRQGEDFGRVVEAYARAASRLRRAVASKGRRRNKFLREFQEAWTSAEELRSRGAAGGGGA